MKRIPALLLLAVVGVACSPPAKSQIFMGPDSARRAQKAADKQQKASRKAARKQQKAAKKYQKQQRKAAKRAQHRA